MNWKRGLEVLVLVAVAAASLWLVWYVRQPAETPPESGEQQQGYIVDGLIVRTDEQGEVIYELRADRIDQLGQDGDAILARVTLDYMVDQERWRMEALEGRIMMDGERVELDRDVVVESPATSMGATRIYTDHLTVLTEPREAMTASPVRIQHRNGQAEGVGMHIWLDDELLNLESEVRGRYKP